MQTASKLAATFIVKAANDIVDVVREETSVVEYCGQHSCNGTGRHDDTMLMLVHLTPQQQSPHVHWVMTIRRFGTSFTY